MNTKRRRKAAAVAAGSLAAGGLAAAAVGPLAGSAAAQTNRFGNEPLASMWIIAAGTLNQQGACSGLTPTKLAAMMMAVSWSELTGTSSIAPSPMTLSRWDSVAVRPENQNLYSFGTIETERRAHWNPGVGLFQLDLLGPSTSMAHWERIYVPTAAAVAADSMRDAYCAGGSEDQRLDRAWSPWYGCAANDCKSLLNSVYDYSSDRFKNLQKDSSISAYGGMVRKSCYYSSAPSPQVFDCYWIHPAYAQGYTNNWGEPYKPEGGSGSSAPTPLATGFYSANYAAHTRAHWRSEETGYSRDIVKYIPYGTNPRNHTTWYGSTSLCAKTIFGWAC